MIDEEKIRAFLADYEALCQARGLALSGCGCCGSPFVAPVEEGQVLCADAKDVGQHVAFTKPCERYPRVADCAGPK